MRTNTQIGMANKKVSWLSKFQSLKELQLNVPDPSVAFDKELFAAKSEKVASMLKENPEEDLSSFFRDVPADQEILELVARFCHGFELKISTDNVIPLICLSHYLGMTESHSVNNLTRKACNFFEQRVLPSWSETIKAFRSASGIHQQALHLGLVDACLESLIEKALVEPRLVGEPIKNLPCEEDVYRPNPRRKLFVNEWKSEDLTSLSLRLYEPTIQALNQRGLPPENIAASLCQYAKMWVFSSGSREGNASVYQMNPRRDVIEAMERLLPRDKGFVPCTFLFEMLKFAISLEASSGCREGLEFRIGKQLDQAKVKDLLIPSQCYSKELHYDIECVRRILKHFYSNFSSSDALPLLSVAELVEGFCMEIASDMDLETDTFVSLGEMSVAASLGLNRNSDGIYRAIDIYLDRHRYLTDTEKEELCKVLDCHKMSPEACEHAAKNEKLPLRFLMQVLFITQLQLRDSVSQQVQVIEDRFRKEEEVEEDEENVEEKEVRTEIEKMSIKVMELEQECNVIRQGIQDGCTHHKNKKEKVTLWKMVKRKLGCTDNINDHDSQVKRKKVHPK